MSCIDVIVKFEPLPRNCRVDELVRGAQKAVKEPSKVSSRKSRKFGPVKNTLLPLLPVKFEAFTLEFLRILLKS